MSCCHDYLNAFDRKGNWINVMAGFFYNKSPLETERIRIWIIKKYWKEQKNDRVKLQGVPGVQWTGLRTYVAGTGLKGTG